MVESIHPDEKTLAAFGLGLASEADSDRIEGHLHDCVQCQALLDTVPDDAVVELVRKSLPNGQHTAGEAATRSEYRNLRFHAKGGLGEISLAQDAVLGREVAVKRLLKQAAGSPERRKRFLREAAITGRLEHPGIAPVYGLGEDEQGNPCYAMRFIPGETLLDAIRLLHKTPPTADTYRPLLGRFVALCSTVAYAHSRGVVHRDIKPSNVAIGEYGETILLDWGLAQTEDDASTPISSENEPSSTPYSRFETQAGTVLGTPGYMAPEQSSGQLVGPTADVFSLGATLWTLLTGSAPTETKTTAAPRALMAVARKAMAASPGERYASATALAADVEAWLADQPLAGVRDPLPVRLARWSRRHRLLVASAAAALIVAATGSAIAAVVLSGKNKELHDAVELAMTNESEANANAKLAAEREAEALENYKTACNAVDKFTVKITEDPRLKQADLEKLRRDLLASATVFYRQLSERHGNDPKLLLQIVNAHIRLGVIEQELGNAVESEKQRRTAIRLLDEFSGLRSSVHTENAARAWLGLSTVLRTQGKTKEALEAVHKARALREESLRLAPTIPPDDNISATYDWWVARLTGEVHGEGPETDAAFARALATMRKIHKEHPQDFSRWELLTRVLTDYGYIKILAGRAKEAGEAWNEARALLNAAATEKALSLEAQESLAKLNNNLSLLAFQNKQMEESAKLQQEALEIYSRLRKAHPSNVYYRTGVAHSVHHLAELKRLNDKLDEAEAMVKNQLDQSLTELSASPGVADVRHSIIDLRIEWASIHIDRKAFAAAADQLAEAETLLKTVRNDDSPRRNLIGGWKEVAIRCKEAPIMERAFNRALALCEVLIRPETTASALEMLKALKEAGCFTNDSRAKRLDDAVYAILKTKPEFQALRDRR